MILRALFVSVFVLAGCKTRSHNETKRPPGSRANEFVQAPKDDSKKTPITNLDALLPKLKARGVAPLAAVWELFSNVQDVRQARHAKVYFGPLTPKQCETLKETFVDSWVKGSSAIDCNRVDLQPGEKFDENFTKVADASGKPIHFLLDHFLTPVMQATLGYTFNEESEETTRTATDAEMKRFGLNPGDGPVMVVEGKYLDTNCWSTAYEVARQEKPDPAKNNVVDFDVHVAPPDAVEAAFLNPDNSTDRTQGGLSADAFKGWIDKWGVNFGDMLLVRGTSMADSDMGSSKMSLLHAAVFVDNGLVYERVGNLPGLPFRLGDVMDTHAQYKDMENVKFHILRMKNALPPVKDDKGLDSSEMAEGTIYVTDGRLESLALTFDASGVFRMDPNGLKRGVQSTQQ